MLFQAYQRSAPRPQLVASATFVEASTPMEKTVLAAWRKVLVLPEDQQLGCGSLCAYNGLKYHTALLQVHP